MTIAFALVLGRGVLAVADGRITNALNQAEPARSDDAEKIEEVQPHLLALIGGAEVASRFAAQALRACDLRQPRQVIQCAANGLIGGMGALRARYTEAFDLAPAQAIRAALVLAGVDAFGKPYVALVDQTKGMPMVISGPRYDRLAIAIFSADAAATSFVQDQLGKVAISNPLDEMQTAEELARGTATAVRSLGEASPSIGGRVRARYLSAAGITTLSL